MGEISNVTNIEQIEAKRDKATAINEKKTELKIREKTVERCAYTLINMLECAEFDKSTHMIIKTIAEMASAKQTINGIRKELVLLKGGAAE